jgi:hypothetical protein
MMCIWHFFRRIHIMLKNYIKTALRNLARSKSHSLINIMGLSVGMAVALLIGLWIYDEVSFDHNFANYDRIAQGIQNVTNNGTVETWTSVPFPLASCRDGGRQMAKVYFGSEDPINKIAGRYFFSYFDTAILVFYAWLVTKLSLPCGAKLVDFPGGGRGLAGDHYGGGELPGDQGWVDQSHQKFADGVGGWTSEVGKGANDVNTLMGYFDAVIRK